MLCTLCKQEKEIVNFPAVKPKVNKRGFSSLCRPCHRRATKASAARYPEKLAARKRRYQVRKYGLTLDQHAAMLRAQDGRCAICLTKPSVDLCIDHDHATGRVRGLLCGRCNKALGGFKDDQDALLRALKYLTAERK